MHQCIRKRPIGSEYQQACRREIQAADGDPSGALESRKAVKNPFTALRIVACRDFVTGLVIDDVAVRLRDTADGKWPPIESDFLRPIDFLTEFGQVAVDRETPFAYPGFDFAA